MEEFSHIKRCLELADRDISFAMEDRGVCRALLERLSAVSRPADGGPKLLLVIARMASQACDWIDGDLRVEIIGDADTTVIEVLSDLGAGMSERVFPAFPMRVPLEEFTRAVERVPHMIEPLSVVTKTARRVVFGASEEVRKSTMPPPMVEIDANSLYDSATFPRAPAIPQEPLDERPSRARAAMGYVRGQTEMPPRPKLQPARSVPAPPRVSLPPMRIEAPRIEEKVQTGFPGRPAAPRIVKRATSAPPIKRTVPAVPSEPPDETAIDTGWEDDD